MTLPILDKTYEFTRTGAISTVNQAFTASGTILTDCQAIMFALKRALINFTTAPWTVVGSSNGVGSFSMAGTDYWAAAANLIWASGATNHSWIVLKSAGIGLAGGLQMCIDLHTSNPQTIDIVISPVAGFTGGSATARPTATDETILLTNSAWKSGSSVNGVLHVWHSTDDQVMNVVFFEANTATLWLHASAPKNPIAGWTKPSVYWAVNTSVLNTSSHYGAANGHGVISGQVAFFMTGESVNNSLIEVTMSFPDDNTAEWPFGPMGLYSSSASNRGRKGQLFDMWWGSTTNVSGDNYPADASKQFTQFVHVIFPWNGTSALTS